MARGHVVATSALALNEWFRRPRTPEELEDQEALLPSTDARGLGPAGAARAAALYRMVKRARSRDMDLAIAAYATTRRASLTDFGRSSTTKQAAG